MARSRRPRDVRATKIGPESRIQPRSVGQRKNSTWPKSARAVSSTRRARVSTAGESTRIRTFSPAAILRTISP